MTLSLAVATAAAMSLYTGCAPSAADQSWIADARGAWRQQVRAIRAVRPPAIVEVVLFDRRCRLGSGDALALRPDASWVAAAHGGKVRLGDGTSIPVGVTSLAGQGATGQTFVMALPSLWREAKVGGGPIGLKALTTAVLLHEASHVAQGQLLGQVSTLIDRQGWGASFDDDSIQRRFEKQSAFAESVAKETSLLLAAAAAIDDAEARRLAGEASRRMKVRRARWFTGKDRALDLAEDLFLTIEGSGQYVGYHWLTDPAGGGFSRTTALKGWGTRGRWWSQKQGLALILAVERLRLPGWQGQVWGNPQRTGKRLLDAALAQPDA